MELRIMSMLFYKDFKDTAVAISLSISATSPESLLLQDTL